MTRRSGQLLSASVAWWLVLGAVRPGVSAQPPDGCDRLASRSFPDARITSAARVEAGRFSPPAGRRGASEPFAELGAFCRITTTTEVPPASEAKTEIWLPIAGWNHQLQPAGGGFFGGAIPYARMREILRTGSATSGSDAAIEGGGANVVLSHPEKLSNIGNVPFHVMIDQAKALIRAFYGTAPLETLMDECGNGGSRDVLAVVQRWPDDLDAASAVGATNFGTHHGIAQMWLYWATHRDQGSYIPIEKYPVIHQAALDACGARDGVIEDPPHCRFDPAVLLCSAADSPTCLTAPQVAAVRMIYETPRHARTNQPLYGPMVPGSELSWEDMTAKPRPYPYAELFYRFFVFHDPGWDYKTFRPDFAADVDRADAPQNLPINAVNPNIAPFVDHGGKLLMMAGWNDDLGPGNNVTYYENVVRTIGAAKARKGVRLFMVPGMHHCLGLEYPSTYRVDFDLPGAITRWKQTGRAPDQIVVTTTRKAQPPRRRLVCAYPTVSQYKGSGNVADPANFICRIPRSSPGAVDDGR
jgi:feruloyl esterase